MGTEEGVKGVGVGDGLRGIVVRKRVEGARGMGIGGAKGVGVGDGLRGIVVRKR